MTVCIVAAALLVTILGVVLYRRCRPSREPLLRLEKVVGWETLVSKVVSTHRTGTHPEQPLPTGYMGIPFIVG